MKRLIFALAILAALPAWGQILPVPSSIIGACKDPSGNLIALYADINGTAIAPLPGTLALAGLNTNGSYYDLTCDTSGHIIAGGLAGGALGSAPYQTALNTTGFIASPTISGTYVYAWQPGGAIIAPTAVNANTLSVGTATNATNVAVTSKADNTTYYLALLGFNSTSNQGVDVGPATYNPSTNTTSMNTSGSAGSVPFSGITNGTNNAAAMVIGTGASQDIGETGVGAWGTNNANALYDTALLNNTSTGTTATYTACVDTTTAQSAVSCSANAVQQVLGIVVAGAGTTGYPKILRLGATTTATFVGSTTSVVGNYATTSSAVGKLLDTASTTRPTCGNAIVGIITSVETGTTHTVLVRPEALPACTVGVLQGNGTAVAASTALANGTTSTTQSTGDNSTKIATTAYVQTTAVNPNTPAWLQYLGDGSDSSNTNASGNMDGEYYYTNFTVPYGNTVTVSGSSGSACGGQCWGLTIHATGTCTIAGTITNIGYSASTSGRGGGVAGGSGGGSSAGAGGNWTYPNSVSSVSGGAAGTSSGGNGVNAYQYFSSTSQATSLIRTSLNTNPFADGVMSIGAPGVGGANSGGVGGAGGDAITLICGSIVGTDGTHTGIIDASGHAGGPPTGNSTGAGSGGGGAPVILSSQATVGTWPAAYVAGGPGGWNVVPYATWTGGTCTSPAKATLGVSVGALSGACTVVQAGAGCGTGAGTTLQVLGGGGTLGTGTVTPTWSGGALASCTATAGSSSGYTATTYTTAGTGGDGGYGWVAEFSGW